MLHFTFANNSPVECKTAEEIRKYLGVKNDYTPAEEEAVVRDNLWIETGKIIN